MIYFIDLKFNLFVLGSNNWNVEFTMSWPDFLKPCPISYEVSSICFYVHPDIFRKGFCAAGDETCRKTWDLSKGEWRLRRVRVYIYCESNLPHPHNNAHIERVHLVIRRHEAHVDAYNKSHQLPTLKTATTTMCLTKRVLCLRDKSSSLQNWTINVSCADCCLFVVRQIRYQLFILQK